MTSAESGNLKCLSEIRDLEEEKRFENARFADDYKVQSKSRSQGVSLNDLVQLHSPIRHGFVRYIGEIPNINQHCDFFGIALCGKYTKMGKHNGTFRGITFFTASKKSGIFCKRHKIKKVLKRSALSGFNRQFKRLSLTDEKKLQLFSRTVKRLTGLLSSASFGSECDTPSAKHDNTPLLSAVYYKSQKKDATDSPSNITSIVLSPNSTYSDSSNDDLTRIIIDETEVLSPIHENTNVVRFSGISWEDEDNRPRAANVSKTSTPDSYDSSQFLKISSRHDTLGRILKATMSTEQSEDLKHELEDDFTLYAVSQVARESLKSKQDVKELIKNLQICINVLKTHIPKVTKMLDANDLDNTVYMTNVIQDLLKRAQNEKLSKKILTDFSGIRTLNYNGTNAFTRSDIAALVETMAWIRNNLCIAGLTDENDAMMTLMGAEEVQQSLVGILKKLDCKQVLGAERRSSVPIDEPSLDIKKQSEAEGPDSPRAFV